MATLARVFVVPMPHAQLPTMFLFASVILVTQEMLSYLVQELPPHLQGFLNQWILVVLLRVEVTLSAKGEGMLLLVNVSLIISVIPMLPVVQNVPQMQSAPQTKHAKDCTVWTHVQMLDAVLMHSVKLLTIFPTVCVYLDT